MGIKNLLQMNNSNSVLKAFSTFLLFYFSLLLHLDQGALASLYPGLGSPQSLSLKQDGLMWRH